MFAIYLESYVFKILIIIINITVSFGRIKKGIEERNIALIFLTEL
jgi:hypothetical protein